MPGTARERRTDAIVWDYDNGRTRLVLDPPSPEPHPTRFPPPGIPTVREVHSAELSDLVFVATASEVVVVDATTLQVRSRMAPKDTQIVDMAVSLDESLLAVLLRGGSDESAPEFEVRILGVESLDLRRRIEAGQRLCSDIFYSPDGQGLLVLCGERSPSVRALDLRSATWIETMPGHDSRILDLEFSPDGSRIATSSMDRTVRIWDAATREEIVAISLEGTASFARFSPDGATLITNDGQIRRSAGPP